MLPHAPVPPASRSPSGTVTPVHPEEVLKGSPEEVVRGLCRFTLSVARALLLALRSSEGPARLCRLHASQRPRWHPAFESRCPALCSAISSGWHPAFSLGGCGFVVSSGFKICHPERREGSATRSRSAFFAIAPMLSPFRSAAILAAPLFVLDVPPLSPQCCPTLYLSRLRRREEEGRSQMRPEGGWHLLPCCTAAIPLSRPTESNSQLFFVAPASRRHISHLPIRVRVILLTLAPTA